METVDVPRLPRRIGANLDDKRLQEIRRRSMIAMVVLDAAIQREFVIRPHVKLERRKPWPFSVVDAFGVGAIVFAAGLPVSFEQSRSMVGERTEELGLCHRCDPEAAGNRTSCNQLPFRAAPGHRLPPWPGVVQVRRRFTVVVSRARSSVGATLLQCATR